MMSEKNKNNRRLWKWVAIISGAFSIFICFLLIANYIQINRLDPVNTEAVNSLVQRLSENPNDEALRNEIRALDLLVRKAYFTNQWQIKTGGYIAFISIAVMLIAFQVLSLTKPIEPDLDEESNENDQLLKKISRKWISIGGISIVAIALVLAFLTHEKLENTFAQAAVIAANEEIIEGEDGPAQLQAPVETEQEEEMPEPKEEEAVASEMVRVEENPVVEETQIEDSPSAGAAGDSKESSFAEASEDKKINTSDYLQKIRHQFPSFRGAGGLGIAYQKNVPTQWDATSNDNILWKVKIDYKGYNSPIIWDDKLFLTGADAAKKEVFCYHKNTGDLIWSKEITNIPGSPDAPEVTEDTGHAAPTAATDGKHVYAIFSNGDIVALDMDGNQVWGKNLGLPRNHYGHSSSLLVYEDKLIVQYDHGNSARVLALSTNEGAELWSTPRDVKISWASPVIVNRNGQTEVILSSDPFVAGYDVNTGRELWSIKCMMGEVGPSVTYLDGLVFALNEYASLVAISGGNNPQILWESYDYLSDVPSPVATKGLLFVATSYGVVVCHNAKTGEIIWEQEFDNGFYSSPILIGDLIYLIDREGITYIFKAQDTFELLHQSPLGEQVVTTPAFADGQLFVRGEEHLYGIGKAK